MTYLILSPDTLELKLNILMIKVFICFFCSDRNSRSDNRQCWICWHHQPLVCSVQVSYRERIDSKEHSFWGGFIKLIFIIIIFLIGAIEYCKPPVFLWMSVEDNYLVFANKTDDKSRKMVDRIPTGGVMSAMQNITAPEEGGGLHALSSSSQKTVSSHTQSQPDPASC